MKERKNLLLGFMLMFMIFIIAPCQMVQAMDNITLPAMEEETTVTFRADVPEGFSEDIEIFLNRSPYYMTAQSGYVIKVGLEPAEYEVRVILSGDITNQYQAEYAETINSETEKDITIRITYAPDADIENDGEEHILTDIENLEDVTEPKIYDFSDGKEHGTLLISREQYGAIKTATYRLVGKDTVYDISLDREYMGQAKVLLPVGDYYESGTINVVLAQDATVPDDSHFLWQHESNLGSWGNYYTVSAGETTAINDLVIMISSEGDVFEANSSLLFSKTYSDNHESLAESHRKEALESAFPEIYETSETETIAAVIPVEEPKTLFFFDAVILISVIMVLIILIALIVKIRSKRGKKNGINPKH